MLPLLVLVGGSIGIGAAVLFLPAGHALLGRAATKWISRRVAGSVEIRSVRGDVWREITLEGVVIRDSAGALVLSAPEFHAAYVLPELLAGRMVFHDVEADSLVLHLVQLRSGRWNYEQVFRIGGGKGGGASPEVALNGVRVRNGSLRVDVPTTPGKPKRPASRNATAPAQPQIAAGREGPVRVYTASDFNADFRLLRISTPSHAPVLAQITALRTRLSDPAVTIIQLTGQLVTASDTLRFSLDSARLPGTKISGGGALRWPHGSVLYDFTLHADPLTLADLHWIDPDFPDWTGRGDVTALSLSATRNEFRITKLSVGVDSSRATGVLTAITDQQRGLGVRGLDLDLRKVPIGVLRPYLDTLPVAGVLTGHLAASGFLDSLRLDGNLAYADALVSGRPVSHLLIGGVVHFGGPPGAVFETFQLDDALIPLATVHQLVPSVILPGQLHLVGRLDGPWRDARFVGTAEHDAPNGAVSRLVGAVRLDSRGAVLGVEMDADFDQLSFDALRSGYPDLTPRGALTGHVVTSGNLDSLEIHASVSGEIGTVNAAGRVAVNTPHFAADSLVLNVQRLDAGAILGRGNATSLNGKLTATGVLDSGMPPRGRLDIALDRSRFGGATVDQVFGVVHAAQGIITVDTGSVIWPEGRINAHGTLGWSPPDSGTLVVTAVARSLTPFDSLVRDMVQLAPDTLHPHRLDGSARAVLAISGSRVAPAVNGTVTARNVALDDWHAADVTARVDADSLGVRSLSIVAQADTIGQGKHFADHLDVTLSGRLDSLLFNGSGRMLALDGAAAGSWQSDATREVVRLNRMSLDFPRQHWELDQPLRIAFDSGGPVLGSAVTLSTLDGSGTIRVDGALPGRTPGDLDVAVNGLDLADVATVWRHDTAGVSGWATVNLHVGGTRDAPTFQGNAAITGLVAGGVRVPLINTSIDYAARLLRSDITLWETGQPVFTLNLALPYDLALTSRADRKVAGPLSISGSADSVDMRILGALFPSVQSPTGRLDLDVYGSGTWLAPRLQGSVTIQNGGLSLPSLGVRYGNIRARARFVADSMVIDTLHLASGEGSLDVTGSARFPGLAHPSLDFRAVANDFLAADMPDYLTMRATGDVTLSGELLHPVLAGSVVTVNQGVLYFADLITKNVVDLGDPANAALVDTTVLRRRGLGNDFASRFLDSLRIDNLVFRLGNDVWLRSEEANVQLEGQLTVSKLRKQYLLGGDLNAPRGAYSLKVGVLPGTDFTIQSGTVRYSRTPDLNADLDLKAEHVVHTAEGESIPIDAEITGTIRVPKVTLSSPGRALSTRDMVSYLLFGRSEFQLAGSGANTQQLDQYVEQSASAILLGAASSELQRAALSSSTGLNMLEIRPGTTPGGLVAGASPTQLAAGWQLGRRWFVSFDAGFCLSQGASLQSRNFGASVEYRIAREWRFQAAARPVQACITNRASDIFTTLNRYQLGGDLLWQRDY